VPPVNENLEEKGGHLSIEQREKRGGHELVGQAIF
jgi:hypothetical protein